MKNFIRNIKQHKKIALICLVLLIVLVALVVVVMKLGKSSGDQSDESQGDDNSSQYFSDSKYPLTVSVNGSVATVSLEAKDSSDMKWECSEETQGVALAKLEGNDTEKKLTSTITAQSIGYTTVVYKRTGELNGVKYDAVNIRVDIAVYAADDGKLLVRVDKVSQNTSSSGAVDSKTPYLLKENRVILPEGGDWTLTVDAEGKVPEGLYRIMQGTDENGHSYYDVSMDTSLIIKDNGETDVNALNSRILLKSESLGIKKKLKCVMNAEKEWTLTEAEE